ncbi:extensin-like [Helianthus annuus]|uniref:extensin-like n=1 Tax=Helianthus annuus TaxID=4232 RepID=UPI000B8F232B|nr:extensin-like [Helianthus annuus]
MSSFGSHTSRVTRRNHADKRITSLVAKEMAKAILQIVSEINEVKSSSSIDSKSDSPKATFSFKQFKACDPKDFTSEDGPSAMFQWFNSIEQAQVQAPPALPAPLPAPQGNPAAPAPAAHARACYACGDPNDFANVCPNRVVKQEPQQQPSHQQQQQQQPQQSAQQAAGGRAFNINVLQAQTENNVVNGYNPLGPEDHFPHEMEMDGDQDPEMQTRTPGHPISISSGSPFQGSPYCRPDSFQERMATYDWYFTPSYHSSPAQPPLIEPQLQAVSPPTLPVEEPPQQPPQPPPEPSRRRRNARISVRGGPRFSSPQGSSSYPPILEDPQMGGPSNAAPEIDPPPASYAPPQPPMGFDNPIPTYLGSSGYNPFENPSGYPSEYGTHDPYLTAAEYHHLYPSSYPPVYPTRYPV